MDINRYRYIVTLAKIKNYTTAAKALHISQPALTKAIKKTEGEFGVTLFERDGIPFRLTYAGERFIDEVKKILNVQDMLEKEMKDIVQGKRGKVTIGIPSETAADWLPMILPSFIERNPDVEVVVVEGNSDSFEKGLLEGMIDFSIYTLPVNSPDLDYEIVEEHPILLVTSSTHKFAKGIDKEKNSPNTPHYLEPDKLNREKLLTLTPDRGMYRVAMQILERHGIKVNIAPQLTSNYTTSCLAAAGLGVYFTSYVAAMKLRNEAFLHPVFYTLDDPVFMRKAIVAYRKGNGFSPIARDMLEVTKQVVNRRSRQQIKVCYELESIK